MISARVERAQIRITWRKIMAWLGPRDKTAILVCAAFVFGLALLRFGWLEAMACCALGGIGAAITLIDLRHFRIPDLLSLPLIPLGIFATEVAVAPLLPRLLAMVVVWAVLTLMQRSFVALRGRSGLGSGDVKLMAAASAWLDPIVFPSFILAAAGTGLFEGLLRRSGFESRIAFGAHLAPWLMVFVLAA